MRKCPFMHISWNFRTWKILDRVQGIQRQNNKLVAYKEMRIRLTSDFWWAKTNVTVKKKKVILSSKEKGHSMPKYQGQVQWQENNSEMSEIKLQWAGERERTREVTWLTEPLAQNNKRLLMFLIVCWNSESTSS